MTSRSWTGLFSRKKRGVPSPEMQAALAKQEPLEKSTPRLQVPRPRPVELSRFKLGCPGIRSRFSLNARALASSSTYQQRIRSRSSTEPPLPDHNVACGGSEGEFSYGARRGEPSPVRRLPQARQNCWCSAHRQEGQSARSTLSAASPREPRLYGVATLAAWVPARRAGRIDPSPLLQSEVIGVRQSSGSSVRGV